MGGEGGEAEDNRLGIGEAATKEEEREERGEDHRGMQNSSLPSPGERASPPILLQA